MYLVCNVFNLSTQLRCNYATDWAAKCNHWLMLSVAKCDQIASVLWIKGYYQKNIAQCLTSVIVNIV